MSAVEAEFISEGVRVIEHHKEGNLEQLTKKLTEEIEKLNDLIERLEADNLLDKNTDRKTALDELSRLKKLFDKTMEKVDTFRMYEQVLEVKEQMKIAEVETFNKKYELRHKIWDGWNNFEEKKTEWYHTPFADQNS